MKTQAAAPILDSQMSPWIFNLILALALLVGLALESPFAFAQNSSSRSSSTIEPRASRGFVLRNADSFSRDTDRKVMTLEGNVQLIYGEQHLSADRATIYEATQEIEAEGHLVINSSTVYAEGDRARLNYQTGEGVIYNGFVRSGQVVFEGRVVRKIGPDEYEAESAYYTACTTCPPAWSFSGSRIRAKLGGYAYIKNSVFEVAHFPVFWLPYLIVPLKSERQTGLLIPTLDFSGNGGTAVGLSFFWALSRSQDLTLTAKNYSFRGLKGLGNYRYVLTDTSYGEANAAFIQDQVFVNDPGFFEARNSTTFNRWFLTFQNVYDLPYGFTQKAKINLVSDLFYPRDFPEEMGGYGEPALENRVSLTRNLEREHSSIDVQVYQNLLKSNPVADNSDAVHRFPTLRYSLMERPLFSLPVLFRFDSEYVNFAREDFAFDDVENGTIDVNRGGASPGAGIFNPESDILRAGQRFELRPEISKPFMLGRVVDVLPSLTVSHTQYAFNVTPSADSGFNTSPTRTLARGRIVMRTLLSRVLGGPSEEPGATRFKHELEPLVAVSTVPWVEQPLHPFFGADNRVPAFREAEPVSNADFLAGRGIQFDYEDRRPTRNLVTLGLANRLIRKSWSANSAAYRQVVNFRLTQSYDIDEARKEEHPRFPWSDIASFLDVRGERFETNTILRYYPYHNATNTSARARLRNAGGDFIETRFEQHFRITETLEADYANRQENVGLGAGITRKAVVLSGSIDFQPERWAPLALETKSWSADMTFRPPGDCWSVRTTVLQVIGTGPVYSLSFDYQFGGEGV